MEDTGEFLSRIVARSFRFLPTNLISRVWGRVTRTHSSRFLVAPFSRAFRIDAAEAEFGLNEYSSLNAFFTRRLKPGSRPVDSDAAACVSPVDGRVSESGVCAQDHLLQVKGIPYDLYGLLRDNFMARTFESGHYLTLYLSPKDYHRIHSPMDLSIDGLGYMPGALLPVNPPSVRYVEGLYTQNERLMLYATSPAGRVGMVLVGANCVGSVQLNFDSFTTNRPGVGPKRLNFQQPFQVKKGDEIGRFEMGSTVILLFEKGRIELTPPQGGMAVRMGQKIGRIVRV